jgi:hypothetical protein
VGEKRKLHGIEACGLAPDGQGADDPVTDAEALGHGPALAVTLGAAGEAGAGDGGVGRVDHDSGDGARGRYRGAHAVDEAHEEALAAVGGLDGTPQGILHEADGVGARDQAP